MPRLVRSPACFAPPQMGLQVRVLNSERVGWREFQPRSSVLVFKNFYRDIGSGFGRAGAALPALAAAPNNRFCWSCSWYVAVIRSLHGRNKLVAGTGTERRGSGEIVMSIAAVNARPLGLPKAQPAVPPVTRPALQIRSSHDDKRKILFVTSELTDWSRPAASPTCPPPCPEHLAHATMCVC